MSGRLWQRSFETREGDKRTNVELLVDEIWASLRSPQCRSSTSLETAR